MEELEFFIKFPKGGARKLSRLLVGPQRRRLKSGGSGRRASGIREISWLTGLVGGGLEDSWAAGRDNRALWLGTCSEEPVCVGVNSGSQIS